MNRKKARLSHFSSLVRQINEHDGRPSASNCHLIDNEYFAAFDSLDAIQKFHAKVNEQPAGIVTDDESEAQQSEDVDMKLFAQQYLVDLPEQVTEVVSLNGTSSQDLFLTDQPVNWSPRAKGNKHVLSSAGRSDCSLLVKLDCPSPR